VTPTDIDVVFDGPVRERLNQLGLLNREQEELWVRHQCEIQRKRREHGAWIELRRLRRPGERAVQTTMVEDPNPLADNAVGAPQGIGTGHRLQHHRPDTGQSQFIGQHQSVRAGTGDDDINHLVKLSSRPVRPTTMSDW
jgi:hypothetical protein